MYKELVEFRWKFFFQRVYQKAKELDIFVNAMSLVYTTLLSMIPLLIFSFYIITLFNFFGGMDEIIESLKAIILKTLATGTGQTVINYLEGYITNIDIGQLGVISFFSFVIVITFMLARIEKTFNKIWGVEKHRDFFKRFVAFWTFITLGTFLIALSLSLTISFVRSYIDSGIETLENGSIFRIINLISSFLIFTIAYYLIPNTEVEPKAAIIGGIISGTLFEVAKVSYTVYTKNVVAYSQIYGSLSVIPLFLIWLYLIWLITLIGAIISYVVQYRANLYHFNNLEDITIGVQNLIPIAILVVICKAFSDKESKGLLFEELAGRINVPVDIIKDNLQGLMDVNLISITKDNRYMPVTSLEKITLWEVLDLLILNNKVGINEVFLDEEICQLYDYTKDKLKIKLNEVTIIDILNKEEVVE